MPRYVVHNYFVVRAPFLPAPSVQWGWRTEAGRRVQLYHRIMKFSIRKNEDSGGASSNRKPLSSPDSTVASSGSKFSFLSPFNDSKVNKSAEGGKGNNTATPVASNKRMSAGSLAHRSKGDAFLQEADAILKKSTLPGSSTTKKNERAVKSVKNAAEAYKSGGWYDEAGKAYQRAADLHKDKLKNKLEASKCLTDAGECLKKSNPTMSTSCFRLAAILLGNAGAADSATSTAAKSESVKITKAAGKKSSEEAIRSTQGGTKLLEKENKSLEKENKLLEKKKNTLEKKNLSLQKKLTKDKPATAGLMTSGNIFSAKGKQKKKTGLKGFLSEMNK